jgi:hypothetical protein
MGGFQMFRFMAQALVWSMSRILGVKPDEPAGHGAVEHAHWDPVARDWFAHDGDRGTSVTHAA